MVANTQDTRGRVIDTLCRGGEDRVVYFGRRVDPVMVLEVFIQFGAIRFAPAGLDTLPGKISTRNHAVPHLVESDVF